MAVDDPGGQVPSGDPLTKQDFEALARFRFGIRRYLRFSEETVRRHGVTPQQYQLMLALKGFPGRDWAVVRELADRLQLRHHSVVELVDRAQGQGLVERATDPDDARAVRVVLTDRGEQLLGRLSALHRDELRRMDDVLTLPRFSGAPRDGDRSADDAEGGDPACWLTRVCSACGRLDDGPPPDRCPGCGEPLAG